MRKMVLIGLAAAAAAFCITGCSGKQTAADSAGAASLADSTAQSQSVPGEDAQQIANPWQEFSSIDDAAAQAGFALNVPDTADGLPQSAIRMLQHEEGTTLEVLYFAQDDSPTVCVRKSNLTGDISGVYKEYTVSEEITVNGNTVTLQGNEDVRELAAWQSGDYSYTVYADEGLSAAELEALVSQIS